jgi:hypothetical protein
MNYSPLLSLAELLSPGLVSARQSLLCGWLCAYVEQEFAMWSAIGQMTGLSSPTVADNPAYDASVWPHKATADVEAVNKLLDEQHKQFDDLQNDKQWALHTWKDPSGGDMHLWDRPQKGTFHYAKAIFSVDGTPQDFFDLVGSTELSVRQKFSTDCVGMQALDKPTTDGTILHVKYWAPPPVAGRDFCFLVGRRDNADGSCDLWGSSVSSGLCPEESYQVVRGASLWGWRLIPVGDKTLVHYVNCFDPRGWAPGFLIEWMTTAVAKELCAIRSVLAGKEADLSRVELSEAGVSADEVQSEIAKHDAQEQAAK